MSREIESEAIIELLALKKDMDKTLAACCRHYPSRVDGVTPDPITHTLE